MGNRLSGVRSRNKSSAVDVSSPSTRVDGGAKSPASSAGGSVSVRLRAVAARVRYGRSAGRTASQIVSCPNLGDELSADDLQRHLG